MLLVLIHSDAAWTEAAAAEVQHKANWCFATQEEEVVVVEETLEKSVLTLKATRRLNSTTLCACWPITRVCASLGGDMCAAVMRTQEALLVKVKALVAGGVNTEVEGGGVCSKPSHAEGDGMSGSGS